MTSNITGSISTQAVIGLMPAGSGEGTHTPTNMSGHAAVLQVGGNTKASAAFSGSVRTVTGLGVAPGGGVSVPSGASVPLAGPTSAGLMSAEQFNKLQSIEDGANNIKVDSEFSRVSENPVQNKIITQALDQRAESYITNIELEALCK